MGVRIIFRAWFIGASILFGAVTAANAQMSLPTINPMVIATAAKQDVLSQHLMQLEFEREEREGKVSTETAPAQPDFSYRYVRSRTSQNLKNFVARTPDPTARAELQRVFSAQPDIVESIRAGIRPYGFDADNTADAYALWWINAWLVSEKLDEDPDRATIDAVKDQVYASFAATSIIDEANDAERQEFAEALLLHATILADVFEQVKEDPAILDQVAGAARQGAMAGGLDFKQMLLTPEGFAPR